MKLPNQKSTDLVLFRGPDYTIYYYKPGFYKIVYHKCPAVRSVRISQPKVESGYKNDKKLSQSISRARREIVELALCNDWKWFVTLTFDGAKRNRDGSMLDRYDFSALYEKFKQWHKDLCTKYGRKFPYLLIPEKHKDGAWHMHGFFNSDVDDLLVPFVELDETGYKMPSGKRLPRKLIRGDYYDWPAYRKRFGFCSFGKIRSHKGVALYATKYITKSLFESSEELGKHTYFHTRPLYKAELSGYFYGKNDVLDSALQNHYEYCSTGFFEFEKEPGFDPVQDILEYQELSDCMVRLIFGKDIAPDEEVEIDEYYEATQLAIKGFEIKDGNTKVSMGSARPRNK